MDSCEGGECEVNFVFQAVEFDSRGVTARDWRGRENGAPFNCGC
jgi:hypothetical protein